MSHPTRTAADVTASVGEPAGVTGGEATPPASVPAGVGMSRYVLGEEIARGGMGEVYRATDTVLGREVAVKVLQPKYGPTSAAAHRFKDEARISGQLQHPAIPPVHDLGFLNDGRPFLAMKLIKGDTLDETLKRRASAGEDRGNLVAVFEQVCQAVAYAHAHHVIHRDLKPHNVMVGNYGEVQVMDWGLAKVLTDRTREDVFDPDATSAGTEIRSSRDSEELLTVAGSVLGTPAYMPPEQAIGAVDKIDKRSDVFGLGGILAVILSGAPPFFGPTREVIRQMAAKGKLEDCFARLESCGAEPELISLCKRCLSPEQDDRPADAGAVARDVLAIRMASEQRARRAEIDREKAEVEGREQRKRRRVLVALAGVAALLLVGAGGVGVWRVRESDARTAEEEVRAARAADALAALLDRAELWLGEGEADRAAPFLAQAEERATEAGDAHAERLARDREGLLTLRGLDDIDALRWTSTVGKPTPDDVLVGRWKAAVLASGVDPNATTPAEAADRLRSSPVRGALLGALDNWLARGGGEPVRRVLAAADPDPFRDEVRKALATGDCSTLAALAEQPEWVTQPAGLVMASAAALDLVPDGPRRLLRRVVAVRPGDFGLLMHLGFTYPIGTPNGAEDRVRWFQAAVAARPANAAAHTNLGNALLNKGDADGAVVECREAVRLDPRFAPAHNSLGNALFSKWDWDGAAAAYREALRLNPTFAPAHNNLGATLAQAGDSAGAVAAFRDAIAHDPQYATAHLNLGSRLLVLGELAEAVAELRVAIRIEPKLASAKQKLAVAEHRLDLLSRLPGVLAGEAEPRTPLEACEFAELCWRPTQQRFSDSVRLYETAFALDPKLADDRKAAHRYSAACAALRAARGDGIDAPKDEGGRATLRAKALAWLSHDLSSIRKAAATGELAERQAAIGAMGHWLADTDLSETRPQANRGGWSESEAKAWDQLWADAAATLAEARLPAPRVSGK